MEPRGPVAAVADHIKRASATLRQRVSRLHRARRGLLRAFLTLIYAPAVVVLLMGVAAAAGWLGDLWRLVRALNTHVLDTVPTTYDRLALAGHVAVVSGAFLALLSALVIVAVGCRGRRWWRLYLIPGVPLSAGAALILIYVMQWCMLAANQRLGWSPGVWQTLTALALADAVLVAARVGGIGAGPLGTRRTRLRSRLRTGHTTTGHAPGRPVSRQTRPIPVVRFGPRDTAVPSPDLPNTPDAARGIADAPTAEELRAVAGDTTLANGPQAGAAPVEESCSGAA